MNTLPPLFLAPALALSASTEAAEWQTIQVPGGDHPPAKKSHMLIP